MRSRNPLCGVNTRDIVKRKALTPTRQLQHLVFPSEASDMTPNMLVLYLQPDEGVHWRFEAKVPDTVAQLRSVDMEFHYADSFGKTAIPEAYERLLLDTMTGDASLFTRADEVETAWGIIDPIIRV